MINLRRVNIHVPVTLIGVLVSLIIHSANHVTAVQCIQSCWYGARAFVHFQIGPQNEGEMWWYWFDHDDMDAGARWAGLNVLETPVKRSAGGNPSLRVQRAPVRADRKDTIQLNNHSCYPWWADKHLRMDTRAPTVGKPLSDLFQLVLMIMMTEMIKHFFGEGCLLNVMNVFTRLWSVWGASPDRNHCSCTAASAVRTSVIYVVFNTTTSATERSCCRNTKLKQTLLSLHRALRKQKTKMTHNGSVCSFNQACVVQCAVTLYMTPISTNAGQCWLWKWSLCKTFLGCVIIFLDKSF